MKINESNLKFKSLTYGNNPKSIVLHHAEASKCSIEDIHRWHLNNGWSGCGYHYLVRKDGSIWTGRPETSVGAHVAGFNTNSIGICAEGSYMTETMPIMQRNSVIDLCKHLCNKYGIDKIYGHREVGASNCPGANHPLEEIKKAVLSNKEIKSYIRLDGGGYSSYKNGAPGINLIIRDYSQDIVRAFAWVDSDQRASWAFDIKPPNDNYTKLFKNTSKVVTKRNEGYSFSKNSTYKLKIKAYNKFGQVVTESYIVLKVPKA
ncbi:peptidoglycan recognition family protein [uncultured Clostridium sp.]|uniref:peptidoglycan recognition protein family protein n=1 Tax=uncultured Clostridium sp. TaxID=59620 RepID=UPI0028EF1EB7|nr:peptidoglycan recognition family protein [uncultured Clostridium sp.]